MNTLKSIFLLFILSGIIFIPSCVPVCPDVEYLPFFDVKSMTVNPYRELPFRGVPSEGDTLSFEDFGGVEVNFEVEYLAEAKAHPAFNFSLISSAYACSLVPNGFEGSKEERFQEINLFTKNDFDANHPAGSSLNDLFAVTLNDDTTGLNDFVSQVNENVKQEYLVLKLMQAPDSAVELVLDVEVSFTNSEKYSVSTDAIWLKP